METNRLGTDRPRLFIGSSNEGKDLAEAVQFDLGDGVEAMVWNQGLIRLGETMVESLDRISREVDFAVLVVTPDDIKESRGTRRHVARDNVIFEAGLFMGRLGRERTFLVCPRDHGAELPSDLAGMTLAEYAQGSKENLRAALNPACVLIKEAIARAVGPRDKLELPSASDLGSPKGSVPRPRRASSLGTAIPLSPKRALRIVNISVTGALLQTPGRLPIGQLLDLDLHLDNGTIVSVTASVVRVQEPEWGKVAGVGVRFTQVPERSRAALESFVDTSRPAA